jgi:hypothetical protein
LLAAFQRFTYQYAELQWAQDGDWRALAETFARKIVGYDFWDDTQMCEPIRYDAEGLRRFLETGRPGFLKVPANAVPPDVDEQEVRAYYEKLDVFELWRLLSLLPKTYEDVWRGWFLPTSLGHLTSSPDEQGGAMGKAGGEAGLSELVGASAPVRSQLPLPEALAR